MKETIRFAALAAIACSFLTFVANAERPPNFVVIFADDQGYGDMGCYGHPTLKTPNMDRLAKEGTRFTDFYSLAPICSASRAALLTGSYPLRTGITGVLFPRHQIGLNPDETTIAEVLKQANYATACIGKWHLGHLPPFLPTAHGFDSYYGLPYSNDMDPIQGEDRNLDRVWQSRTALPWNVPLMRNEIIVERPAQQQTLTRRCTEEAVRFIRDHANRPFFLYMPHTMPHVPLYVEDEFYDPDPQQAYAATLAEIDWSVGQVLEAIEEAGVEEQTLVVYTSDNGPWLGKKHHGGSALPLRSGKFSTYEGGMRVPCLMKWPGKIPAGKVSREMGATFDLLPTFAALAGVELPKENIIDGKDLSKMILGKKRSPRDRFFYYRGARLEAVRRGPWKLHLRRPRNRPEEIRSINLYHLPSDIGEQRDEAALNPEIVKELTQLATAFDRELKSSVREVGSID